jgi:2,4-dienoyl-CoA reductase-like NADH-dependent reductase (Old Yellow Enzyme family)
LSEDTASKGPVFCMPNAHSVLLDPIRVGAVTLASRIVMGSMHTGLECHPERFIATCPRN